MRIARVLTAFQRSRLNGAGFVSDMLVGSLWISPLVLMLTGCDRPVHCPTIAGATRVVIEVWSSTGTPRDVQVNDPERIRHLMDFANVRRNCSTPTTYTMPGPRKNVIFYRSSTAEGAIGAGANFFLGLNTATRYLFTRVPLRGQGTLNLSRANAGTSRLSLCFRFASYRSLSTRQRSRSHRRKSVFSMHIQVVLSAPFAVPGQSPTNA
jgi:hypothetical protein